MKKRIKMVLISTILLIAVLVTQFFKNYPFACDLYAETGIKGNIALRINERIMIILDNSDIVYNEIADIVRQTDGSVLNITVDTRNLNLIALEMSNSIYRSIEECKNEFNIPLGNAFGSRLLSGKGAKISVTILPIGSTEYEIESELSSSGINQTLHRISLVFNTSIACLAPFHEYNTTVENRIIIAETLIVGDVPEVIIQR